MDSKTYSFGADATMDWHINYKYDSTETTFQVISYTTYRHAKEAYTAFVNLRYEDVTLSDFDGEIIFEHSKKRKS